MNSELHCHTQFSDTPGLFIKAGCMKIFILISVGLIKGSRQAKRRYQNDGASSLWGTSNKNFQARLWTCAQLTALTFPQADRRMRGRLCGICGDYDGDTVKEFRKPQDNQAPNGQEYASSYAVTDSECGSRAS
jgi:hypothetical protein